MPKAMERRLKAKAASKGLKGERADAYVYGTMRKTGWKPKREIQHIGGMSEHAVNTEPDPIVESKPFDMSMIGCAWDPNHKMDEESTERENNSY